MWLYALAWGRHQMGTFSALLAFVRGIHRSWLRFSLCTMTIQYYKNYVSISIIHLYYMMQCGDRFTLLKLWARDNMDAILQTIFSNAFSWMKTFFALQTKFQWNMLLGVKFTLSQLCFILWLNAEQTTSHCLKHWWPSLLTHTCVNGQ